MLLVVMILTGVTVGLKCDSGYLQVYAEANAEMPNCFEDTETLWLLSKRMESLQF